MGYFVKNTVKTYFIFLIILSFSCQETKVTDPVIDEPGSIQGRVTDLGSDIALVGAEVFTYPASSTVFTDSAGTYKISSINPGNYTVIAIKQFYHSDSISVTVGSGHKVTADIKLQEMINHPPATPVLLNPANNASTIPVITELKWQCSDPDGDSLLYDVYLDKVNPPLSRVSSSQRDTTFTMTGLDSQTVYYWKVVAKDARNAESASGINKFTTVLSALPTLGLVAYYPFNGNANDESGYGNNGTVSGANLTTDRFGNSNKAYAFNGTNNTIQINSNTSNSFGANDSFSLAIWIYRNNTNIPVHILGKRVNCWNYQFNYQLAIDVNGLGFGTDYIGIGYTPALAINKWIFLCYSFNGNKIKLYVDGVFIKESSFYFGARNNEKLVIGGSGSCSTWPGKIDDIRIYRRVLNDNEVQQLYHEGGWYN